MEPRQVGGGSSSEQRLPVVSVLTLWTPACRCRCGTKHRTAAAARLPQQPHSAQGRGATGPWGVGTGAAPSQTGRAWGWDRFWGAEWEGGSPWPRVNEAGQTPGRSKGCPERARALARTGQPRALLLENRAQSGRARLASRRSACLHPATQSAGTAPGGAASHGNIAGPHAAASGQSTLPCKGLGAAEQAQKSAPGPCSP